jgi:hypothetical protein
VGLGGDDNVSGYDFIVNGEPVTRGVNGSGILWVVPWAIELLWRTLMQVLGKKGSWTGSV